MKRTLLFIACVLTSIMMTAQSEQNDYIPFVNMGKQWHVIRSDFGKPCHYDTYTMNEEVAKNGKTYLKMYRHEDLLDVVYDAGLLREEDRKVYMFDTDTQREYLLFDYSLMAGDTYETYSYEYQTTLKYEVLSVSDYTEGPEVVRSVQEADSMTTKYRYLRKWVVQSDVEKELCLEPKTWIEGVGSLEGPFANLYDASPVSSRSYLAYVEFVEDYAFDNQYLPFSFYDTLNRQVHGCNLPKSKASQLEDQDYQLIYELEGDRLHVYGKVALNCAPNDYAYFIEEPTDDPLVHKLHFKIQDVEPLATCYSLFSTDFYVPGFDPNMNYIIVDNQGEEHQVINKTPQIAYRPLVEDGKVWAVRVYPDGYGYMRNDTWTEHYYFASDTIISGQTCKRMFYITNADEKNWVNGVFTPANRPQLYVGAFYEQDKKVYCAAANRQQFEQLYDFTLSSNDSIFLDGGTTLVVDKVSGGIPGFKGTYYNFRLDWDNSGYVVERWLEGVGSDSWPWLSHPYGFCGHQGALLSCSVGDEVIYYNSEEEDPYVMGARKGRFDFTHTIKTQPKAPASPLTPLQRARGTEREENQLYGEYNELRLDINLDPLDDAYLVRITNESGKTVYEKAINAGSIVGLNIDISAFAKGRYTVTVENSQESFTGEFEIQTTGISDASRLNGEGGMTNESIYNLQGQRIRSLQKGLNIVNGKKVLSPL